MLHPLEFSMHEYLNHTGVVLVIDDQTTEHYEKDFVANNDLIGHIEAETKYSEYAKTAMSVYMWRGRFYIKHQ